MTVDEAKAYLGEDDTFTLFADGLEEAFLGLGRRNHQTIAIYSEDGALAILAKQMADGCDKCVKGSVFCEEDHYSEAREYFEFNVVGAWVGEGTPLWISFDEEFDR